MSRTERPDAPRDDGALLPEFTELLLELSTGVHRYAMYPPGHPSLAPLAGAVHRRLHEVLRQRPSITIGVAHHQLVVERGASDPDHPVIGELARRLHDHQLGALSFDKGVTIQQVEDLIGRLSQDVERGYEPLGLLEGRSAPDWPHIGVFPIGYDQLRLSTSDESREAEEGIPADTPADRATELWYTLAASALAGDAGGPGGVDPRSVARRIQEAGEDTDLQEHVVGHLLRLTDELQHRPHGEAEFVRRQVSKLIEALDPGTLERLLDMGGDFDRRKRFVLDASQSLAVDSVVRILQSAAAASGQNISTLLIRLLKKLALHSRMASGSAAEQAQTALLDNVEELITNWNLEDPNPDRYTMVLDAMANAAPALRGESRGEDVSGALRVLQMGLEVDAFGPTVETALNDLYDRREIPALLDLLEDAEHDNEVARRIEELLASPRRYHQLLTEDVLDEPTIRRLAERLGRTAADPLLHVLSESDSRELRRKVFDQLIRMGSVIGDRILEHLRDERWFVQRNMLALAQRMDPRPPGLDPEPYLRHPDARVRREAFALAVTYPEHRARALSLGLADTDERLVRVALQTAAQGLVPAHVPTILHRIVQSDHPPPLRALAIQTLTDSPLPMVRDALVELCLEGRGLLGRKTLAPRSPELLAALRVLARSWSEDPGARKVLDMARRSKDPEIRRAVAPGSEAA